MILKLIYSFSFLLLVAGSLHSTDIMKNAGSYTIDGVPGNLIVFGNSAEVLLSDSDGNAVIAKTDYGKGKLAAFTHGAMLEENTNKTEDNLNVFLNTAEAIGISASEEKKVLIIPNLQTGHLKKTRWKTESKNTVPDNLSSYDLVIISLPIEINSWFKKPDADRLLKYAEKGGRIIGSGMGWVYMSYGDGKKGENIKKFSGNLLFSPAGIFFGTGYSKGKILKSDNKGNENLSGNAVNSAVQILKKGKSVSEKQMNQILNSLSEDLAEVYGSELLSKEHKDFLISQLKENSKLIPSADSPLKKSKTEEILTIALLNFWIQTGNDFPRELFSDQKQIKKLLESRKISSVNYSQTKRKISADLKDIFWIETGLYARPLEIIRIKTDGSLLKNGLKIRIGAQSDILLNFNENLQEWKRWPEVSISKSLNEKEIQIMNPFGGMIFIENRKPGPRAEFSIEGGTEAVSFNSEKHSLDDWKRMLNNSDSEWGIIGNSNIKIVTTERALKKLKDPVKLAKFWDTAWKNSQELLQEKKRNYTQYIVCDTQISLGYMHSGNPIMTWMDQEEIVLGLDGKLFTEGSWGHFHEIGHNMQRGEWTFKGTGEVTTNIFTLYNMEKMFNISPKDHPMLKDTRNKYKAYLKKGGDYNEWKDDAFLALMTYVKLQEKFGWSAYKSVFSQYNSLPEAQKPKNDQEKIDTWVRIFSKTVKMNLFPYFRKWAWPVSDKVNSELKSLPVWNFEG